MTPFTLFEYVFAVVCGLGLGVLLVMWVLAQMIDWDEYEAKKKRRCSCIKSVDRPPQA